MRIFLVLLGVFLSACATDLRMTDPPEIRGSEDLSEDLSEIPQISEGTDSTVQWISIPTESLPSLQGQLEVCPEGTFPVVEFDINIEGWGDFRAVYDVAHDKLALHTEQGLYEMGRDPAIDSESTCWVCGPLQWSGLDGYRVSIGHEPEPQHIRFAFSKDDGIPIVALVVEGGLRGVQLVRVETENSEVEVAEIRSLRVATCLETITQIDI